jgi:nucleoside-diphosphate-sugar epimerase
MKDLLITGFKSGFGRYAYENLGGFGLGRDNQDSLLFAREKGVDTIMHCAFNNPRVLTSNSIHPYMQDNLFLTQNLLKIPHKRFIFMSSVDVYPKSEEIHIESEEIPINLVGNFYGVTKLMSESMIREMSPSSLILRCSGLLGPYMKKNNLTRLIEEENPELTLTKDSELNCILYEDLLDFILVASEKDLNGVYNTTSSSNISFSGVAKLLGKEVDFGEHFYRVGKINNQKIREISPVFSKSSEEVIKQFIKK